ncbi:asialoglycoprotein receptor 2-like [Rhynchonycteris naso]
MAKDFQDIQHLDSEENDHPLGRGEEPGARGYNPRREDAFWKALRSLSHSRHEQGLGTPQLFRCAVPSNSSACPWTSASSPRLGPRKGYVLRGMPPSQPRRQQSLCSRLWLSLLVLGFNVLLLMAICVIASQRTQMQVEFWTLKEAFSNFSSSTLTEIWALGSHSEQALQGNVLGLKNSWVTLEMWLCFRDIFDLLMIFLCSINKAVWGWTIPLASYLHSKETSDPILFLSSLFLHSTPFSLRAWTVTSRAGPWQKFFIQHMRPFKTWIGLTESDGSWKWVDGTDHRNSYKNWAASQPDNWQGSEEGGSEDCTEVQVDGRWIDNFCQQVQRWACEMNWNSTT